MKFDGNYLIINDLVQFKLLDSKLIDIKDNFGQPPAIQTGQEPFSGKKGLQVRIAATHAGIITGNNTFYMPDKVRDGVPSFIENYNKPVLLHHDEEKDPIGRIINARYVDTSLGVKDNWYGKEVKDTQGKLQGTVNEQQLKDFCEGKMPYGMAVDYVRTILDNSVLQDPNYQGLGYAEIVANIRDEAAIEKFLDGRYLTGSVSAATDRAVCSRCKQDWTKDGPCDHRPGSISDGKKVYLIAGNFRYQEYSMVNKPADRHSKVLELYYNGVKDSIELAKDYSGRLYEINLGFPQYESLNSKEEILMKDKEQKVPATDPASETSVKDETTEVVPPVTSSEEVKSTKEAKPEVKDAETVETFLTRVLADNAQVTDEDRKKTYQFVLDEMKAMGLSEAEIAQLTLTDEKAQKLPKSSFIGNRVLPVHDAAHVLVTKRLVDKIAGVKDSYAPALTRKSKALGVKALEDSLANRGKESSVKDNMQHVRVIRSLLTVLEENYYTPPDAKPALGDDDKAMIQTMLKKLASMVGKDNLAKLAGIEKLGLDTATEQVFCDEITALEETVGNLREETKQLTEQRDALKEEYDTLFQEMNALNDSVVEAKSISRQQKISKLSLLLNLKEGKVEDRSVMLGQLADQAIDAELDKLSSEVDIKKITDKLSDGMSRTPTGSVDDPTTVVQDNSRKPDPKELAVIQDNYLKLLFKNRVQAEAYKAREMDRLRKEGKLPK